MIYSGKRCTVCTQLLCKVYSTLLNFLWFTHAPQDFFLHMVDSLFIITIWSTAVLEKNVREKIGIWFEVMNMKVSKYTDFEFIVNFPRSFPYRYSLYEDCEDWNVHCIFEITPTFCQSACFGKCWNGINWSNSMFNHEDQCRGHFCSGSIKGERFRLGEKVELLI